MDLRKSFWEKMESLAEVDSDILVLVGDLGFSFYENFAKRFSNQFINCGIAEQNMVGVAAGLALSGKKPFVYSGSVLLLCRAYEQIRDDVCFAKLPVALIGTGASDFLGYTHNWNQDEGEWNLLKGLPNLSMYFPKNENDLQNLLSIYSKNPQFIRL